MGLARGFGQTLFFSLIPSDKLGLPIYPTIYVTFQITIEELKMKQLGICAAAFLLSACGNPGGISDADYAKYKELGAPKILYSCTREIEINAAAAEASLQCARMKEEEFVACLGKNVSDAKKPKKPIIDVGYAAGVGVAVTFNKLLSDAKAECDKGTYPLKGNGEFKVIDSKS